MRVRLSAESVPSKRHPDRASSTNTKMEPTREEIASRAYELFLARGCQDCGDVEDWLQAERELRSPRL